MNWVIVLTLIGIAVVVYFSLSENPDVQCIMKGGKVIPPRCPDNWESQEACPAITCELP